MNRYPIAQTIAFTALAVAGISLAVLAPDVAGAAPSAVTAIGAAMFGGSLAFFLLELFAWDGAQRRT
jgi:FtsH-binding integral membrane protein